MTDHQQQVDNGSDEPEADIDESDHADGADVFGDIDPDDDLDDQDDQADDQPATSSDQEASTTDQEASDPLGMVDDDRVTVGDVYCNGVGLAAAAAVSSFGADDDPRDRAELMEEYGGLARDLDLDQYVNDALAAHGGPEDLPPAHAAVMMTVVLAVSIAVSEPDATNNLVTSIKSNT